MTTQSSSFALSLLRRSQRLRIETNKHSNCSNKAAPIAVNFNGVRISFPIGHWDILADDEPQRWILAVDRVGTSLRGAFWSAQPEWKCRTNSHRNMRCCPGLRFEFFVVVIARNSFLPIPFLIDSQWEISFSASSQYDSLYADDGEEKLIVRPHFNFTYSQTSQEVGPFDSAPFKSSVHVSDIQVVWRIDMPLFVTCDRLPKHVLIEL